MNNSKYEFELKPIYDSRKSFYGKARIFIEGDIKALVSYSTKVAQTVDGVAEVFGTYSPTTLRHIKEFLHQEGYGTYSKSEIEKLFIR